MRDRPRKRVLRSRLDRGRIAKDLRRLLTVNGNDIVDARLTTRERPGLVERHHANFGETFEVRAPFDQHAISGRGRQCRDDRDRRRDDERARTGDDQKHERAIDPGRSVSSERQRWYHRDDRRQRNDRGCVDAREAIDERLNGRAPRLRGFNEVNDPRESRVASDADDLEVERATTVDRPGVDLVAGALVHRERLAGDRRLD